MEPTAADELRLSPEPIGTSGGGSDRGGCGDGSTSGTFSTFCSANATGGDSWTAGGGRGGGGCCGERASSSSSVLAVPAVVPPG